MNLSNMIVINSLALIRISATINAQKVEVSIIRSGITENHKEQWNISRVKKGGDIITHSLQWSFRCGKLNHDGDADGGVG